MATGTGSGNITLLGDLVQCPLCYEKYDNGINTLIPKMLYKCQHGLCSSCLTTLLEHTDGTTLYCPICKQDYDCANFNSAGYKPFPDHLLIKQLVDVLTNSNDTEEELAKKQKEGEQMQCHLESVREHQKAAEENLMIGEKRLNMAFRTFHATRSELEQITQEYIPVENRHAEMRKCLDQSERDLQNSKEALKNMQIAHCVAKDAYQEAKKIYNDTIQDLKKTESTHDKYEEAYNSFKDEYETIKKEYDELKPKYDHLTDLHMTEEESLKTIEQSVETSNNILRQCKEDSISVAKHLEIVEMEKQYAECRVYYQGKLKTAKSNNNNRYQKWSVVSNSYTKKDHFRVVIGLAYGDKETVIAGPFSISLFSNREMIVLSRMTTHPLHIISPDGDIVGHIGSWGSTPGAFAQPSNVTVNSEQHVIVTDRGNKRVQVLNKTGEYIMELSEGLSWPCGVCVDDSDNIYVTENDGDDKKVVVFRSDGQPLRTFTDPVLKSPCHICYHNQYLYVADYDAKQVHTFTTHGKLLGSVGQEHLVSPIWVSVDKYGNILVGEGQGGNRVTVLSPSGRLITRLGCDGGHIVRGLAVSPALDVYVCDGANGRIIVY